MIVDSTIPTGRAPDRPSPAELPLRPPAYTIAEIYQAVRYGSAARAYEMARSAPIVFSSNAE